MQILFIDKTFIKAIVLISFLFTGDLINPDANPVHNKEILRNGAIFFVSIKVDLDGYFRHFNPMMQLYQDWCSYDLNKDEIKCIVDLHAQTFCASLCVSW